jgi:rare lipoprotein A
MYKGLLLFIFLYSSSHHMEISWKKQEVAGMMQDKKEEKNEKIKKGDDSNSKLPKVLYGTASYYANKFQGRTTANGEVFDQQKMTAACNVLPFGTWIRVTNLRNGRSVIVRVTDRLHVRMTRLVDLSRAGAEKLNYVKSGLTRIKVEVLGKKKPSD